MEVKKFKMKKFQMRIYHDEGFVMVEISKINDINILMAIVNFLERLREWHRVERYAPIFDNFM